MLVQVAAARGARDARDARGAVRPAQEVAHPARDAVARVAVPVSEAVRAVRAVQAVARVVHPDARRIVVHAGHRVQDVRGHVQENANPAVQTDVHHARGVAALALELAGTGVLTVAQAVRRIAK